MGWTTAAAFYYEERITGPDDLTPEMQLVILPSQEHLFSAIMRLKEWLDEKHRMVEPYRDLKTGKRNRGTEWFTCHEKEEDRTSCYIHVDEDELPEEYKNVLKEKEGGIAESIYLSPTSANAECPLSAGLMNMIRDYEQGKLGIESFRQEYHFSGVGESHKAVIKWNPDRENHRRRRVGDPFEYAITPGFYRKNKRSRK